MFVIWFCERNAAGLLLAEQSVTVEPGQLEDQVLRLLIEGKEIVSVDTESAA